MIMPAGLEFCKLAVGGCHPSSQCLLWMLSRSEQCLARPHLLQLLGSLVHCHRPPDLRERRDDDEDQRGTWHNIHPCKIGMLLRMASAAARVRFGANQLT
jgi:hypothetical protein